MKLGRMLDYMPFIDNEEPKFASGLVAPTIRRLYAVLPLIYLLFLIVTVFMWWDIQSRFSAVTDHIMSTQEKIVATQTLVIEALKKVGQTEDLQRKSLGVQAQNSELLSKVHDQATIAAQASTASRKLVTQVAAEHKSEQKVITDEQKNYQKQQQEYEKVLEGEKTKKP